MTDALPVKMDRLLKGKDKGNKAAEKGVRRMTMQARTTLVNVNIEELTIEEIIYFEDTWMQVFNDIHIGNGYGTTVRSFVVDDMYSGELPNRERRGLRGGNNAPSWLGSERSLYYYIPTNWFDILALFESSCSKCGHDDDRRLAKDDVTHRLFETKLCESLRDGPSDRFFELHDCRIVYFSN